MDYVAATIDDQQRKAVRRKPYCSLGVVASVLDEGCASIFETDAYLPAPPVVPFIAVGVFSKLGAGGGSCAGTKQVSRVEKDSAVQLPLFCWCVAHMAMNLSVDKFNQPTK